MLYRAHVKRALDATGALLALLLLSPLIAIIALVVRARLGAPVLFEQVRPGLHGEPFVLQKFRTMTQDRNANGALLPDVRRLTPFGRFLRGTSLDELPELWNVLCGDMSFIGPRPLLVQYLARYSSDQARRHEVRPGITGWAQVNGRNAISWEQRFELDVWYVDHCRSGSTSRSALPTIWKGLKRRGCEPAGSSHHGGIPGIRRPSAWVAASPR